MPTWLQNIINFFGGGLSAIWHAFLNVINFVYQLLTGNINRVLGYAERVYGFALAVDLALKVFLDQDYNPFTRWVVNEFNAVIRQEQNDYNRLLAYINSLRSKASQDITIVQDNLNNGLAALIKWILTVILPPILHDIASALAWIAKYGMYVLDLLTHLEKLFDLLIAFLWSGWLLLFRKYFKQLVTFIFHNWQAWLPAVIPTLEDIISSLF